MTEEEMRREVRQWVGRLIDFGRGDDDDELAEKTIGGIANDLIEIVRGVEDERLGKVRQVLTEWGMDLTNEDHLAEEFAEALHESGAWRLARDLRSALATKEGSDD